MGRAAATRWSGRPARLWRRSRIWTPSGAETFPTSMQSVHFSMVFRHPERTLTGEEVERAVKSVVEACERRFSAKLRA